MNNVENIVNEWIYRVGKDGIELTLSTPLPNGHILHLDFYPLLLMDTYHMYLWYEPAHVESEANIHQAFMTDPENGWDDMRDNIDRAYGVDIEADIWEIVGSRP